MPFLADISAYFCEGGDRTSGGNKEKVMNHFENLFYEFLNETPQIGNPIRDNPDIINKRTLEYGLALKGQKKSGLDVIGMVVSTLLLQHTPYHISIIAESSELPRHLSEKISDYINQIVASYNDEVKNDDNNDEYINLGDLDHEDAITILDKMPAYEDNLYFAGPVRFAGQGLLNAKYSLIYDGTVIKIRNSKHLRLIPNQFGPFPVEFNIVAPLKYVKAIYGGIPDEYIKQISNYEYEVLRKEYY